jgi:hypothetical protein
MLYCHQKGVGSHLLAQQQNRTFYHGSEEKALISVHKMSCADPPISDLLMC